MRSSGANPFQGLWRERLSASRWRRGRSRPAARLHFRRPPFLGFYGDSLASALLANDVRVVGRSFKYHRPRDIWGASVEDPNAIVDVTRSGHTTPNVRATIEPLANDLRAFGQRLPTAAADRAALLDPVSAFCPPASLIRHFCRPTGAFEPAIRAMAGLGRVDSDNRPDRLSAVQCALRRARDRRRACGPCGGERSGGAPANSSFWSTTAPSRAGSCCIAAARSKAATGANGRLALLRRSSAQEDASSPAPPPTASMTTIWFASGSAARMRSIACGAFARSRSSSRPAPSSARWCCPTTTGPARCRRTQLCTISTSRRRASASALLS